MFSRTTFHSEKVFEPLKLNSTKNKRGSGTKTRFSLRATVAFEIIQCPACMLLCQTPTDLIIQTTISLSISKL